MGKRDITIEEFLAWNGKIDLDSYIALLKKLERKEAKFYRLSEDRDFAEDALVVLEDERGSDRWRRKSEELAGIMLKLDKLDAEIEELAREIRRNQRD